jgi:hypothetical protein
MHIVGPSVTERDSWANAASDARYLIVDTHSVIAVRPKFNTSFVVVVADLAAEPFCV